MNRFLTSLVGALFVLSLCACGLSWPPELDPGSKPGTDTMDCSRVRCGPCAPALTLRVSGTAGQPVPEVVMVGAAGACSKDVGIAVCNPPGNGPGRYEIDLQAQGYRPVHLVEEVRAVEVTGCCGCGYEPRTVNVQLQAE